MPESYVPECEVIMLGCRAWDNTPAAPGACPVCGPGIRPEHNSRYCAKCDRVSPAKQRHIDLALRVERIGVDHLSRSEIAENKAKSMLRAAENKRKPLTEVERRRMWNGYRGGILKELDGELTNVAKTCRDWLSLIGMEPNWSLLLDRHGNVTGICDPGIIIEIFR